jgi:hypothetical protein
MNSPGCFIRNNWEPDFAAAVDKAAKKAEFQPATNNGKSRDVVLYYQVEFLKKNDDETINVYLHPAIQENIDEYGEDHIAAQRIVDKETWAKACPKRAGWVVTAKAHIDSSGVASSVDLEHNAGILPTGACQVALVQTIEGSGFVPAHDDGVAVPSSYYESFGN